MRRALPDEGLLDKIGVPQLLAEAWRLRRSGRLRLAQGKRERLIAVVDGSPIAVESKGEPDSLGRALEAAGKILASDRRRVEQLASERGCNHASAAIALKLIEPVALYPIIRGEAKQRIAETFAWETGAFQWSALSAEAAGNAKPFDVLSLIQTELPRRWGNERLFAAALSFASQRADVAPRLRRVAVALSEAGPTAARVLERLDGATPLGRILGELAGDPLAAATIWTFWHAGILRPAESAAQPAAAISPSEELDFELEVSEAAAPPPSAPAQSTSAQAAAPAAPLDAEAQALRDDIEALAASLGKLDHYAVLGLDASANAAAIKKAYFKAAKRYHPDSLARKGLAGLEDQAARVFGRISEAFEVLTDPDKKSAYDRGASAEPEIDTARLAQAETSFRKGEILLKMGNFLGALEYLQPAVDLWPEEPAYQSALGWALYKQPASDPERARTHLERAHSQSPRDAVTMFRYGTVLRALGENDLGGELLARAKSLGATGNL